VTPRKLTPPDATPQQGLLSRQTHIIARSEQTDRFDTRGAVYDYRNGHGHGKDQPGRYERRDGPQEPNHEDVTDEFEHW